MTATNGRAIARLDGLDLARFVAFVGMVVVNFKIVMGAGGGDGGLLETLTGVLEGRAAATFVVLAGIGLGLAARRADHHRTVAITLKRAGFLLVVGLLNALVFDADIIHYYAFYFLFGVFCLPLSNRLLIALIAGLNLVFVVLILTLDYEAGWNWSDYSYSDFWTPVGFVRNLFFNGWHPVFPWLSFLLFGIVLGRLDLGDAATQDRMIIFGLVSTLAVEVLSAFLIGTIAGSDPDLAALFGTSPVPPVPLYILAGMGVAAATIGLCLRLSAGLASIGILKFVLPAGRQTLTLYIAHILIGMGTLEALGMLGEQSLGVAVATALAFCVAATVFAFVWSAAFKRGPVEMAMRRIAG